MGIWNSDYKPIWRQRIKHTEWDVDWLHYTKWDLLEWRWLNRFNLKEYEKQTNVKDVQVYGKRVYIDLQKAADFIINNSKWS